MPLRLRLTGEGLRITGPSRSTSGPRPPQPPQALLRTEDGYVIVTESGEPLLMEPPREQ